MAVYTRYDSAAAAIVRGIGAVIAIVLAAHVLFVLLNANPGNSMVNFVADAARLLAVWFHNLFRTGNADMNLVLNYGLAIVFWLVVAGIIARIVRRAG